ncbi:MAG TPA: PIN domain-containing protein [Thermoanaerobaculia bacterium]
MIVVDTSVLIDLLRRRETAAVRRLRAIEIEELPLAIPAICCQEVLQGARDERDWNELLETLTSRMLLSPRDAAATHIAAARLYYDCRRRGITIRSSADCFIAQLVLEEEAVLLHDDEDFERLREVCPLETLRS